MNMTTICGANALTLKCNICDKEFLDCEQLEKHLGAVPTVVKLYLSDQLG